MGITAEAGAVPRAELAKRFRALADEKRLRILERLCGGECCVCELTDDLEAGQSLLSFHLKTLKEAGLVVDRREGRWVYYALSPEAIRELERFLVGFGPSAIPAGSRERRPGRAARKEIDG